MKKAVEPLMATFCTAQLVMMIVSVAVLVEDTRLAWFVSAISVNVQLATVVVSRELLPRFTAKEASRPILAKDEAAITSDPPVELPTKMSDENCGVRILVKAQELISKVLKVTWLMVRTSPP
jgi:hypothetical protein